MLLKIKRIDVLVIVVTTIVTGFTNLAVGVACGLIVNLTSFAWDSVASVRLTAKEDLEGDELDEATGQPRLTRVYEVRSRRPPSLSLFSKPHLLKSYDFRCLGVLWPFGCWHMRSRAITLFPIQWNSLSGAVGCCRWRRWRRRRSPRARS